MPDFIIRAGGEMRMSNFVLWQGAYSELYFSPKLWPDFSEQDLDTALVEFILYAFCQKLLFFEPRLPYPTFHLWKLKILLFL